MHPTSPLVASLRWSLLSLMVVLLGACGTEPVIDDDDDDLAPLEGCGDGVVEELEECDEGAANSDSAANACRSDCRLPRCGDFVVDSGEECDLGGYWGGTGCSPLCVFEAGPWETELNDTLQTAQTLPEGGVVQGSLPPGDRDCFGFGVELDNWLGGDVLAESGCPEAVQLELFDPAGNLVALATPGEGGGCAQLDPVVHEGARFMQLGSWGVCLSGFLGQTVPDYRLELELGEDSCSLEGLVFPINSDPDGDGLNNDCDPDDDNDGILDGQDNCPEVPNGPNMDPVFTDSSGWIKDWLTVGEFVGADTTESCRASEFNFLGDDALATASLGDLVDGLPWLMFRSDNRRINFLDYYGGPTDREVYALVWVRSDTTRELTLAIGPDDGARIWVNGDVIDDISGCQGTNVDQFQSDVTLLEGWNRVLVKVRDHGGGWGMLFRFLDQDVPVEGLEVSLIENQSWLDDQGDLDGDGVGDACDETPGGS